MLVFWPLGCAAVISDDIVIKLLFLAAISAASATIAAPQARTKSQLKFHDACTASPLLPP